MRISVNIGGYPVLTSTGSIQYFSKAEFEEWFKNRFYPDSAAVYANVEGSDVYIAGPVASDMLLNGDSLIALNCNLNSHVHIELDFVNRKN